MKLNEVRKLVLFNSISITNSFVSKEFLLANYNLCDSLCNDILVKHCGKFLPRKFSLKFNLCLMLSSLCLFGILNAFMNNWIYSLLFSTFLVLNLDFVFSKSFKNFVCRIMLKDVFKVKIRFKLKFKNYDFVIIKFSNDNKVVNVCTTDSNVKGYNPKVYLVHKDYLYLAIFDYMNGAKNSLDINKLCSKVYSALTLEVDTYNYIMSK